MAHSHHRQAGTQWEVTDRYAGREEHAKTATQHEGLAVYGLQLPDDHLGRRLLIPGWSTQGGLRGGPSASPQWAECEYRRGWGGREASASLLRPRPPSTARRRPRIAPRGSTPHGEGRMRTVLVTTMNVSLVAG